MPRSARQNAQIERYEVDRSPFAQNPTQRDVASLIGETRDDLRRLVNYKEGFIVRRQTISGKKGKVRDLAYPEGRLRAAHERLKFHLNKIKQPSYLFSPRRKRGQRDNAAHHLDQQQYLTLDLKQFYPSTTDYMVRRWFQEHLGMYEDVAGLLTHLCTIDGKVSFGSPLTPVLCSLIHRPMFDQIAAICDARGLRYSVWVDDLTISGRFVPREILNQIRAIVRAVGLKSHRIIYRSGNRPVFITGIGVVGSKLVAPNSLNLRIKDSWSDYHAAETDEERDSVCQRLLSYLGTLRHISGAASEAGRKASDQMNSLRQKRDARHRAAEKARQDRRNEQSNTAMIDTEDAPF
jgi:RNA-directed DNA polymerase